MVYVGKDGWFYEIIDFMFDGFIKVVCDQMCIVVDVGLNEFLNVVLLLFVDYRFDVVFLVMC